MRSIVSWFKAAAPERRSLALALTAFALLALIRAWVFYWFPGLPALYSKDLGVNYIIAEYMRHSIHSPIDAFDMLGWSSWWDQPFFLDNGYTSYIAIVPVADLLGNTWSSIKLIEILQITGALLGTYWLLRQFGRPRVWSLAAGAVYAAMPAVALMPRGNLDLGWPTVLAPACIAFGIALIRRFGVRSLPLCGIACALVGLCSAIEYALFVTAPIYVILVAYGFRRSNLGRWLFFSLAGALVTCAFGAYFVVPTFTTHVFSDSEVRLATLTAGTFVPTYSENLAAAIGVVPREALLSPVPLYNVTDQLPAATVGGLTLWLLGIIGLIGYWRRITRSAFGVTSLVVVGMTVFLSASALLPGGTALWQFIDSLPVLDAIRTPDRFIAIPMLAVALFSIEGLRSICETMPNQKQTGAILLGTILCAFFYVDNAQSVWANQQDYGTEEPALNIVNHVVGEIGPRTASLAFVNGGTDGDYPAYGVPVSTFSGLNDFAARYVTDGIAMTGILSRTSTRSVITTPNWAFGSEEYPSFSELFSHTRATHMVLRDHGVRVFTVNADPAITATRVACLGGGPGLLDLLLGLPALRHVDFTDERADCRIQLWNDRDAVDPTLSLAKWHASGESLCPTCAIARDADYLFYPGRELLNQSWYRNSIDGDDPLFDPRGAVVLGDETTITIPAVLLPESTPLRMRFASHAFATLRFICGTEARQVRIVPFVGFRWIRLPISHPNECKPLEIVTHVDASWPSNVPTSPGDIALDGIAAIPARAAAEQAADSLDFIAFALDHMGPMTAARFFEQRSAASSSPRLSLRWNGPPGVVLATARLEGEPASSSDAQISIDGVRATCCLPQSDRSGRALMSASADVRSGDRISVWTKNNMLRVQGLDAVLLTGSLSLYSMSPDVLSGDINFASGLSAFSQLGRIDSLPADAISSQGVTGRRGSSVATTIPTPANVRTIVIGFFAGDGAGSAGAALQCGAERRRATITAGSNVEIVVHPHARSCALSIRWLGQLALQRLVVNETLSGVNEDRSIWIPRGVYKVAAYRKELSPISMAGLSLDGQSLSAARPIIIEKSGPHVLTAANSSPLGHLLLFTPASFRAETGGALSFHDTGAIRYALNVTRTTDVKIDHLDDGNWELRDGRNVSFGVRCDVVATCYQHVTKGTYRITHRFPMNVAIGFLVSFLSILIAAASFWLPRRAVLRTREESVDAL